MIYAYSFFLMLYGFFYLLGSILVTLRKLAHFIVLTIPYTYYELHFTKI